MGQTAPLGIVCSFQLSLGFILNEAGWNFITASSCVNYAEVSILWLGGTKHDSNVDMSIDYDTDGQC